MFDELLRELKRMDGTHTVSVPIHADAEGYFDKECPNDECQSGFKIFAEDWRNIVRDEEMFCPFCRHGAPADQWHTTEQVEAAKQAAIAQFQGRINKAMSQDADHWNRRQPRDSFLKITMKVDSRPGHVFLPPMAAEPMRLKITCPACSCRYAVIGAAFFCPACGHNAANLMFTQSIAAIRNALDAIPGVRAAIADRDAAETTIRLFNGMPRPSTRPGFRRCPRLAGTCSRTSPRAARFGSPRQASSTTTTSRTPIWAR